MATLIPYKKVQRSDGGFDFYNGNNKIDVNQYVQGTGANKAQLVQNMANAGDMYSQNYLKPKPVQNTQPQQNFFSNLANFVNNIPSGIVSGAQQAAGWVGDVATQGGATLGHIGAATNPLVSQQQRDKNVNAYDQNLIKSNSTTNNLRNIIHAQTDLSGNKIEGTAPVDQSAANIATGHASAQDLSKVAGNALNGALGVTMFANPAALARQPAQGLLKTALKTSGRDSLLFGTTSGVNSGLQNYGQTGDINQALKAGAQGALQGGLSAGAMDLGGAAIGAGMHKAVPVAKATVKKIEQVNPQVAQIDETLKNYQTAFDKETNPTRRKEINQGIAQLNSQRRSIVQNGSIKIPGKSTDNIDPLKQEAMKYNSAEEFANTLLQKNPLPKNNGQIKSEQIHNEMQALEGKYLRNESTLADNEKYISLQKELNNTDSRDTLGKYLGNDYDLKSQRRKLIDLYNQSHTTATTPKNTDAGHIPQGQSLPGNLSTGSMAERPKMNKNLNPETSSLQNQGPQLAGKQTPVEKVGFQQEQPYMETSSSPLNRPTSSVGQGFQGMPELPKLTKPKQSNSPIELRSRGFIESIKNDANTPQNVKDNISSLYQVRNTKELQLKAANLVKENPDLAQHVAMSNTGDVSQMVGSELIKLHNAQGNIENSITLAQEIARRATEHGQASQALSAYSKLTPEGILRFTQKEINRFNEANKLSDSKQIKLTPEKANSLTDQSTALQSMPEGRAKDIATQKMLNEVKEILPAGWVKKVSTLQTIGQLLNPKTAIRNIVGNSLFGSLDNISQVGAAGLDKITSKVLKTERTTALPNLAVQAKGIAKGAKDAIEEIDKEVNLGPDTQFELSQVHTFQSEFMKGIEDTLGYTLRVPDRAAYQAAFDDTLHGLMKANKSEKPTEAMLELANANGLYKTFQDNSSASKLFSGLKQALNYVGFEKNGSRFGLGDLILKYPKTPGNIIARGLDYSPLGIVKGLYQIVRPAITKQPFDQHTFVNSLSRGALGSGGLIGAGAVLGALGIITEKPSSDTDTRNLQKTSGLGGYQINVDALRRFFISGFNKDSAKIQKGDTLVSYDWAQPLSIPLSAGAAIGKGQNALDGATSTIENLSSGLNTLVEQPLVSGVQTFTNNLKNKGFIGALGETAKAAPASFVPTLLNQTRQLSDNTTRNTYDPSALQTSVNQVINKVPGLDRMLQPQVDVLGNNKENYQGGTNNLFNVLLNPSFVSKYNPQAAAELPLDILNKSGETQQMPRTIATSQSVNGTNVKITAQQNHDLQKYVGTKTNDYYNQLLADPSFMARTDQEKAKIMSGGLTDIAKAGKVAVLGDGGKISVAQQAIINGGTSTKNALGSSSTATDPASKYQAHLKAYNDAKAAGTLSAPKDYATQQSLAKESVTSQYPQAVLDFYGMSKAQQNAFFSQDRTKATELYDQAKQLDSQLVSKGLATTKYKTAITGKKASKGRRVSTDSMAKYMKIPTVKAPKAATAFSNSKSSLAKAGVKTTKLKAPNLKNYRVANAPKLPKVKVA